MKHSPFAFFRKHQRIGMVIVTVMAMFAFVFMDSMGKGGSGSSARAGQVVVNVKGGNLTDAQLQELRMQRRVVNDFVAEVIKEISFADTENKRPEQQVSQIIRSNLFGIEWPGYTDSDATLVWGQVMRLEARRLGLVVTDPMIDSFIKRITEHKLKAEQFRSVLKGLGLREKMLYDMLREELLARNAFLITQPRIDPTPEQYWHYYRQMKVRQNLEVAALPVSEFAKSIKDPTDRELEAFFNQHKNRFPEQGPDYATPGFRQSSKVLVQYLTSTYEEIEKTIPPITDQEVTDFYEKKKDVLYREIEKPADKPAGEQDPLNPDIAPDGTGKPATSEGAGAPKDTPAKDAPAKEEPAKDAPTKDAATTEKKPEEKPAEKTEEKPAADKPADEKPAEPKEEPKAEEKKPEDKKPVENKPEEKKEETSCAVQPGGDQTVAPVVLQEEPAKDAPAADQKPEEKPAEKPAPAAPATEEKPAAEEKPAESKPADAQPAEAKPAAPKAEAAKPADPKATEGAPAKEGPMKDGAVKEGAAKDPAAKDGPAFEEVPVKYQPLTATLKENIREELLKNKTDEAIRKKGEEAVKLLDGRNLKYNLPVSISGNTAYVDFNEDGVVDAGEPTVESKEPLNAETAEKIPAEVTAELKLKVMKLAAADLQAVGKKLGMKFSSTGLITDKEITDTPGLGKVAELSEDFQSNGTGSIINVLFGKEQLYNPEVGKVPVEEDLYVYWKADAVKTHIPKFTDAGIKEAVLKAWKMEQAYPLAVKRGEELAKQAGQQKLEVAFKDQTVNNDKGGMPLTVHETGDFSWMSPGIPSPQAMDTPSPVLSTVNFVEDADEEFMQVACDELAVGESGVAPNRNHSVVYVLRVINREPKAGEETERMRETYMKERLFEMNFMQFRLNSVYSHIASRDYMRLSYNWMEGLKKKYQISFTNEELNY